MNAYRTSLLGCASLLFACGNSVEEQQVLSDEEWAIAATLSPLPAPPDDPTNRFADDPAAAALGQRLFFERRSSGPLKVADDGTNGGLGAVGDTGQVSCASCHLPDSYFSDSRSKPGNVSLGVSFTPRNAPSLVNVAQYEWHGWGGKQDSLWTQASLSPESGVNSAANRCGYARVVYMYYRDDYEAVTGVRLPDALDPSHPEAARFPTSCKPKKSGEPDGPYEMMDPADRQLVNELMGNCGKSVAAYERLLVSVNAPFDRFVAGEKEALSFSAQRGLKLFVGSAGCVDCHKGPNFTDNLFHNTAVPQVGPNVPEMDPGRYEDVLGAKKHEFNSGSIYSDAPEVGQAKLKDLAQDEDQIGAFRTKALRHVAKTAPYFHNGSAATLREVVEFYNRGGATEGFAGKKDPRMVPLNLSERDIDDLVAFLESLTGEPVAEALQEDTSAP